MPIAIHRHSAGKEPVARMARMLVCGAAVVAGCYFAMLYLLTSR